MALLWRRHRWTALRSLLLVALLHRLHCLAFLAASSPVWLLAAFLLGVVLVHSDPHVPLAATTEDEDRHLYKKIRRRAAGGSSSFSSSSSSSSDGSGNTSSMEEDVEEEHLTGDKEAAKKPAAVAWTADDEHSIRSIGSLELERDARLEKLMSRRSIHRNLIDLDVHIPAAVLTKNPALDLHGHHHESSEPGSAPSFLLAQHNSNPFDFPAETLLYRRHESFTAGAPLARPSRFRPYFVADVPEGGGGDAAGSDNSNSSSSPSSTASIDHQQVHHQGHAAAAAQQHAPDAAPGMVVAVDVELISDSSDDDMSLPGDDATAGSLDDIVVPPDEDVEDSFEVESITQQVAAAGTCRRNGAAMTALEMVSSSSAPSPSRRQRHQEEDASISSMASVEENDKIRERHNLGPVPVIDSSPTSAGAGVGAAGAVVAVAVAPPAAAAAPPATPAAAAAPATPAATAPPATPAAAAAPPAPAASTPSAKPSSKSKASSKKAVFGFFRK
ncbi:unnamed protein product [Urochloa humidicola]